MPTDGALVLAAKGGDHAAFARLVSPHRRELYAHCYRMSGSLQDAEDLLQESLLRAWKGLPGFAGRAELRTWLYKVTTNVCIDSLDQKLARRLPMELQPAAEPDATLGAPRFDPIWLEPCPADLYQAAPPSPEARYGERESVTLAFLTALQLLPAKQRVVLLLRDVVGWEATECAALLDLSVAAVNSALQRARETLAAHGEAPLRPPRHATDKETTVLLSRYVRAWELADIDALVALLHEDATLAMPPFSDWFSGVRAIASSLSHMVFQPAGPGAFRLLPTEANGLPAFAAYERDPATGAWNGKALHLLELREGRIASIMAFLYPSLFPRFGLPAMLSNS